MHCKCENNSSFNWYKLRGLARHNLELGFSRDVAGKSFLSAFGFIFKKNLGSAMVNGWEKNDLIFFGLMAIVLYTILAR